MTKNEIVARWMGYKFDSTIWPSTKGAYQAIIPSLNLNIWVTEDELRFNKSYDWLHEAWVKFRDLKPQGINFNLMHATYCNRISMAIPFGTITEAFDELVKGIEWYESLKK